MSGDCVLVVKFLKGLIERQWRGHRLRWQADDDVMYVIYALHMSYVVYAIARLLSF